jgi:hypothetical protein
MSGRLFLFKILSCRSDIDKKFRFTIATVQILFNVQSYFVWRLNAEVYSSIAKAEFRHSKGRNYVTSEAKTRISRRIPKTLTSPTLMQSE